ncbi:MAG: tRNA uridine 5-carboxymethylaminomethyl modification enzyme MnmG [candidate division TA06 bacterium 32_111]|uniref:tRNA uridine 5-carboxymethylaminomethyl modification enzyme MnmG n=2 Tax=Bacteria candidate phyla TaxID=1783234 RepID=A0A101I260_UNCT6|nr:MAG: tRNA uridine 5-carboxymethylaminomethyl modification enzyme MnmG [candidate division TA06 bacterium 32_111]KUK87363.1 MAG: tRNA uridine 5-carboxymethylaminomethyl modification enzyme MnmG [candidate division TA06 bacterium 34_109]HAF07804.1 tRNA uridine-5-carboxymethylaminomethyl(34) synthesis enzyme MnmG [candidate division WOR-3 bacterium]HCP17322.1 tRNA uridine-5-carboxymethylaminomethyl(34) synthesis enzyme MnmG [candidate division WOR-3 bacterium]
MSQYDIVIVGGGHAGIEAATISSYLNLKVLLVTFKKEKIGFPSCNPSIGGIGKSHLVYELDVLSGSMPILADKSGIHFKLLNSSKGPAVWSLRAQIDSSTYPANALKILNGFKNLTIVEDEVTDILVQSDRVIGVKLEKGQNIQTNYVVICSGTFLGGKIFIGNEQITGGRFSEKNSQKLSESLKSIGIKLIRLKTGTSPRLKKNSVDFSKMEEQKGEEDVGTFSILTDKVENRISCYITRTNEKTHKTIRDNLHLSALYSGNIEGKGPRYCPSLEDKVVKFSERKSHTIFIEPMGVDNEIVYVNGASSSLPVDIQLEYIHSIKGLEKSVFIQPGYAIEYDALKSKQIKPTLEHKNIKGLFFAGQINGTSGYEEAAAQGYVAGLNASLSYMKKEEIIFDRFNSYIGVLIDDIIKKDLTEPYRLFTSRSENRLYLRQDNSFVRLKDIAEKINIDDERRKLYKKIFEESEELKKIIYKDPDNFILKSEYEFLKDPSYPFESFKKLFPQFSTKTLLFIYSENKYRGYIEKYKRITKVVLENGERLIKNKKRLLSSPIISKEAKEIISKTDVERVKDLYGIIDPSDIENIIIILKKI